MNEMMKLLPEAAWNHVVNGAVFLDITDDEGFSVLAYDQVNSIELTLLELLDKLPEMDKTLMYVAGGYDEATGFKAANLLAVNGFEKVGYIADGIRGWFQEGLPVRYHVSGSCGMGNEDHCNDDSSDGCGSCSCGCGE